MSFEDIVRGSGAATSPRQDHSDVVAEGVFRIHTSVSRYKSLVNKLRTQSGNRHATCEKLHVMDQEISHLIQQTISKLKEENIKMDHFAYASTSMKLYRDAKLAKDFQAVLVELHCTQREFHNSFPRGGSSRLRRATSEDTEETSLLQPPCQQVVMEVNESDVECNAAVIGGRGPGILDVLQQIKEVKEIFKDMASVVADQGGDIESTESATVEANTHLTRAEEPKTNSNQAITLPGKKLSNWSKWTLVLAIVGTGLLIIIFA